jgi:hypothetical protein
LAKAAGAIESVTFSPGRRSSFEITLISEGKENDALPAGKWNVYSKLEESEFPNFPGIAEEVKNALDDKAAPSHWKELK